MDTSAEWYGIDPPFPSGIFGDEKLVAGAYINGGIFPLCGGEIAKAAFDNGLEEYGLSTLSQYAEMVEASGETYLWYFPDGTASSVETSTSPEATATDGWGASSMLFALIEGLAGIDDRGHSFEHLSLSPRWIAAGEDEASVELTYAASGVGGRYRFEHEADMGRIQVKVDFPFRSLDVRVLLPAGPSHSLLVWMASVSRVLIETAGDSRYAVFRTVHRDAPGEEAAFTVQYGIAS